MNECSLKWRGCRNSPNDRSLSYKRRLDGIRGTTVRKNDPTDAAIDGAKRRLDFHEHAAAGCGQGRFWRVSVDLRDQGRLVVSFAQETRGIRKEKEPIGAHGRGQ